MDLWTKGATTSAAIARSASRAEPKPLPKPRDCSCGSETPGLPDEAESSAACRQTSLRLRIGCKPEMEPYWQTACTQKPIDDAGNRQGDVLPSIPAPEQVKIMRLLRSIRATG